MLRIYVGFQAIKFYRFSPPRPPPPHFNCFPSTSTTTFLLFSFYHHHHISIVFPPPPPPPPPPHFYCFPFTTTFVLFSHHHHHHRHHISIVFPPPPPPPPPHFHSFPSSTTTTFLLFSLHHHKHLISIVLLPRDSIRDYQLPFLVHFVAMSRVVSNNRGFLQLLADYAAYQRQFLLKTATPQQLHALVQVLYNILMGHIPIPEENKRILLPYKDALLNLACPMSLSKQRSEFLYKRVVVLLKMY